LCTMLPYAIERDPHELLPAMPPSVACALVETSTGNHRPCGTQHRVQGIERDPGLDHRGSLARRRHPAPGAGISNGRSRAPPRRSGRTASFRLRARAPEPRARSRSQCAARAASAVRGTTTPTGSTW
jgi:hypothetical protein